MGGGWSSPPAQQGGGRIKGGGGGGLITLSAPKHPCFHRGTDPLTQQGNHMPLRICWSFLLDLLCGANARLAMVPRGPTLPFPPNGKEEPRPVCPSAHRHCQSKQPEACSMHVGHPCCPEQLQCAANEEHASAAKPVWWRYGNGYGHAMDGIPEGESEAWCKLGLPFEPE